MANTVVVYPGNGVTREFTVPFDYLNRTFIHVYINDVEEAQGTAWYFLTPTVIQRAVAPAVGENITIRRVTSSNRIVDFKDASVLRSLDLNTSQLQVLHIAEEAKDMIVDTISTDSYGNLDARWRRIIHVSNPVEDGDALNYRTYKADINGAVVARDRAEAAAQKAESHEATTAHYANGAQSYKVAAEAAATAAKASETTASTAATTATNAAKSASTSASSANTDANAAKGWAESVKGQAEIAKEWADQANEDADRACRCADSVDLSVFESRVSALEAEDVNINQRIDSTNATVSKHTSSISTLNTNLKTVNTQITDLKAFNQKTTSNINSLESRKVNKTGDTITGYLNVNAPLRSIYDHLDFGTSASTQGMVFTWTDGVNKMWDDVNNAIMSYTEFGRVNGEWSTGWCASWKVNGASTGHSIHLTSTGKLLVDKQEVRYVKQSYVAEGGSPWYRIWSDGWIEQGGSLVISSDTTLTYVTPFAHTIGEARNILITPAAGDFGDINIAAREDSPTTFTVFGSGWHGVVRFSWYTCGF